MMTENIAETSSTPSLPAPLLDDDSAKAEALATAAGSEVGRGADSVAAKKPASNSSGHKPGLTGIRFDDVVSGQFDVEEEVAEVPAPKRVLAPNSTGFWAAATR